MPFIKYKYASLSSFRASQVVLEVGRSHLPRGDVRDAVQSCCEELPEVGGQELPSKNRIFLPGRTRGQRSPEAQWSIGSQRV